MDPIVHRDRTITVHPHGLVSTEVRIDGEFAGQWNIRSDAAVALAKSVLDRLAASPEAYPRMRPCWYHPDDPRRAEAQRSHGVPVREKRP